jgi:hypothetical protein
MAYGSTASDDYLYVTWTSDGITWNGKAYTTLNTSYSPAIAFYNGNLWVAWISDGKNGLTKGVLYVDYTNNPSAGFSASPIAVLNSFDNPYIPSSSPTLAVYNNQLWIASVDSDDNIITWGTTDGSSFVSASACQGNANDPSGNKPRLDAQVGMAVFNGRMYYAYQTNAQTVRVCATNGGVSDATYSSAGGTSTGGGVSATVYDGHLTFTFKDNTSGNHPVIVGTTDGVNYTGETAAFSMNGNNEITPGTAVYNNHFYVVMTAPAANHKQWTAVGY